MAELMVSEERGLDRLSGGHASDEAKDLAKRVADRYRMVCAKPLGVETLCLIVTLADDAEEPEPMAPVNRGTHRRKKSGGTRRKKTGGGKRSGKGGTRYESEPSPEAAARVNELVGAGA